MALLMIPCANCRSFQNLRSLSIHRYKRVNRPHQNVENPARTHLSTCTFGVQKEIHYATQQQVATVARHISSQSMDTCGRYAKTGQALGAMIFTPTSFDMSSTR